MNKDEVGGMLKTQFEDFFKRKYPFGILAILYEKFKYISKPEGMEVCKIIFEHTRFMPQIEDFDAAIKEYEKRSNTGGRKNNSCDYCCGTSLVRCYNLKTGEEATFRCDCNSYPGDLNPRTKKYSNAIEWTWGKLKQDQVSPFFWKKEELPEINAFKKEVGTKDLKVLAECFKGYF